MHKLKNQLARALSVTFTTLLLSSCGAAQQGGYGAHSEAQLPVSRVVLYQNGIGYFERTGKLEGNILTLQIRPSQINDLLKSLTVIDKSEGRAMSVSLPLEKTSAQILSELPEQVRGAGGLLDVLRVFRGARVTVEGSEGSASGRVVGVEAMQRSVDDNVLNDWRLTLKGNGGELSVYPVSAIQKISMRDRSLAMGLDQSLDVSLNEGNWKPITLSVRLSGSSTHDLRVSYIVEMPLWKPAYRIVVGDDGKPLLQGWAVVDNVSGEDWNNVQLSLVAGTPMSFIYDLHTPQFMKRVDLTPRHRRTAMAPTMESSGVAVASPAIAAESLSDSPMVRSYGREKNKPKYDKVGSRARRSAAKSSAPRGSSAMYGGALGTVGKDRDAESMIESIEQQAGRSAGGESVGALFRYDLASPVTVPDRSSTLVSIINERVAGKEVVYFRSEQLYGAAEVNPYRAVMFENNTEFSLEKGPVSIFAGGTFVGEGFLLRTEQGATTFLTYSLDGKVALTPKSRNKQEGMRLLKIVGGVIVSEVLEVRSSIYQIVNRHKEDVVAYVKTPKRSGWKLRTKPPGTVELPDSFVVPLDVAKAGSGTLTIDWVKPVVRRIAIDTSLSTTVLKLYLASGKAPANVQKSIDSILKLKTRIGEISEDQGRYQKQHNDASRDQNRVRSNLNLLRKSPGNKALRAQLTKKLAALEGTLGKLSGKLVQLSEESAQLSRKVTVLIRGISISVK